jgi:hypothetical protein
VAQLRTRAHRRAARISALAAAAAIAVGLSVAPAAGATSLSMWPTFECYHYPNGTASLSVDKLQVNEDGLTTVWGAILYRWNGAGWVHYWSSSVEHFTDSVFGQLEEQPINVTVGPNSYYEAEIVMYTNDGRGTQYAYAQPIAGRYSSTACHT